MRAEAVPEPVNAADVVALANTINDRWQDGLPQLLSYPMDDAGEQEEGEPRLILEPYTGRTPARAPVQTAVWELVAATGVGLSLVVDLVWLPGSRGSEETRVLWVEDMATALPEPEMTASILWGRLFAATAPDILETRGTVVSDSLVVLSLHQGEAA